jgi:3'(2'), 5'-bisphosphate nucleotidase
MRSRGCWTLPADVAGQPPERLAFAPVDTARLRLCESAASGHSDRAAVARVVETLGGAVSLHLNSQAKYVVVARGQADAFLRMPVRADDRECIWDHAPGAIIAEEAGVQVSDMVGIPLDFTTGRRLERNRGILCASLDWHGRLTAAVSAVLSAQDRR